MIRMLALYRFEVDCGLQVPMSEYQMHDSNALNLLKTVTRVPQSLAKLALSEDKGGLISVGQNGVWVCPGHRATLHVCTSSMLGRSSPPNHDIAGLKPKMRFRGDV